VGSGEGRGGSSTSQRDEGEEHAAPSGRGGQSRHAKKPRVIPPLVRAALKGRHVMIPCAMYPTYACKEFEGRGWAARVVKVAYGVATVKPLHGSFASAHWDVDVVLSWDPLK